jgi:hypothetical protein
VGGGGVVGSIVGDMLPPQCAAIFKKITGFAGRKYRGRIFQPGFSESDQNRGTWGAGSNPFLLYGLYSTFLVTTIVDTDDSEYVWVVCNKAGTSPVTQITDVRFDSTVRTQRRRVQGVGT